MVVRGTVDPTTAPNVNGVYATGNTVASGQSVAYVGTATNFTDTGLSNGTTYYYRVYTFDKAYNYSTALTTSGAPAVPTSPTLNAVTLSSALTCTYPNTSSGVSFTASGSNLTGNITATAQTGYEVSTDNSTYGASVSVASGTTVYVRFAASRAAGNYNSATAVVLSGGGAASSVNVTTSSSGNTVSQKALTITGASATSRVYDGTTTIAITGGSLTTGSGAGQVLSGDAANVTLGGSPTGTVSSKDVGNTKSVTVTGYSLSGTASGNYTVTQPTVLTADITAKALSVTAPTIASKAYDGTTTAGAITVGTLSGFVGSETVTATGAAAAYSSANVGTYNNVTITYTLVNGTNGGLATNYTLANGTGSGSVTAKALTITGLSASSKVYDGTTSVSVTGTPVYSGLASGENPSVTGTVTWAFPDASVGNNKTLTRTGSYDVPSSNYTLTQPILQANITQGTVPTLTVAPGATVDNSFDVTFTETTSLWRDSITSITVGGTTLASSAYSVSPGKITFSPSASTLLQSSGSKTIVVIATGFSNASVSQTIGAGAPAKVVITTQPTAPAENGAALAIQPVVAIQDQYGNATTSTASVTAAAVQGTWALGGTTTVAAVGGTVTFSGLKATSDAAVASVTVTFTSGSLTAATSSAFNIPAPYRVNLTAAGTPVTENFNSLASTASSVLPTGWYISESGSNADGAYAATDGSSSTGDTFSFGASGSSERALGGLRSNNLQTKWGAKVVNNTGSTATSLAVSYVGEQWRLGAISRNDTLTVEYSLDATSLSTGSWTAVAGLAFTAPISTGTVGALNGNDAANRTTVSASITGLSLANGGTIWIRWVDNDATGADDGLGIDDFSIVVPVAPTIATGTAGSFTSTGATISGNNASADGGAAISERGVVYGTSENPTTASIKLTATGTTGSFNSILTGLSSGTTYYVRAYAINAIGTSYGSQVAVLTVPSAPSAPTASNVVTGGFTLNWPATTGATGYRLDVSSASNFATLVSGYSDLTVNGTSQVVSDLSPGTTYYARLRAANASGTGVNSSTLSQTTKGTSSIAVNGGTTSLIYSGAALGPTFTVTGSTGAVTYSYTGTGGTTYGTSATAPTNVGSYTVTATVAADANFDGATSSATAFTINAASLASNQITLTPGTGSSYSAIGPAESSFTISYSGRTANGIATSYSSASAPTAAGYYTVSATATGNYSGSNTADYFVAGPVATADSRTKSAGNAAQLIPISELLANDSRITSTGTVETTGLTLSVVTSGSGNTEIAGAFIKFTPSSASTDTFTYTVTDGTTTATATVAITTEAQAPSFDLQIVKVGTATLAGGNTTVTHDFIGVPNQTYLVEYATDLNGAWTSAGNQNTGTTGSFSVTFTKSGDVAADWNAHMFFRARLVP
jgi:hypothetical protein